MNDRANAVRLIALGEIAKLTGRGPSAVSNWRRRDSTFPAPVEGGKFKYQDIIEWLKATGRDYNSGALSTDLLASAWRAADQARGVMASGDLLELMVQLLLVRHAKSAPAARLWPISDLWDTLSETASTNSTGYAKAWANQLENLDSKTARLLHLGQSTQKLNAASFAQLVQLVDSLDKSDSSLTDFADTLITNYGVDSTRTKSVVGTDPLIDLAVALLAPIRSDVYDPICGLGGFLAAAWKERDTPDVRLLGQESDPQRLRISELQLMLRAANYELEFGNASADDRFWDLHAQAVFAMPPLGQRLRSDWLESQDSTGTKVGKDAAADWFWVEHVAGHLASSGNGIVVSSPRALFQQASKEVRRELVLSEKLDAIIELPPGTIPGTSIPPSLVMCAGNRKRRRDTILFVDAKRVGARDGGSRPALDEHGINAIVQCVESFRTGTFSPVERFSKVATFGEILTNDAVLSPNMYVNQVEEVSEIDGEPIVSRARRLRKELFGQAGLLPPELQELVGVWEPPEDTTK